MMPRFKQVVAGTVVNIIEATPEFAAAHGYVAAAPGDVIAGRDVDAKTAALAELERIDAETGMSRLLRETLLAIAGDKAPAALVSKEAAASAERAKLK